MDAPTHGAASRLDGNTIRASEAPAQLAASAPGGCTLELEPLEAPARSADAADSAVDGEAHELRMTTEDPFLTLATNEYRSGHIDQPLWDHAAAQNSDEAMVVAAYLHARATSLQIKARRKRASRTPKPAAADASPAAEPTQGAAGADAAAAPVPAPAIRGRRHRIGAAAVALLVLIVVAWTFSPSNEPAPVAATTTSVAATTSVAPVASVPLPAPEPSPAAHTGPDWMHEIKIEEFRKAGNWNVLVLYAGDWTRKEPANAIAWNALAEGYARLRQLDDALDASGRAVELAPAEPRYWRTLGQVNLALERFPEAASALDKALAGLPEDADTLCAAALVARGQGKPKDAEALGRRVAALDASCSTLVTVEQPVASTATESPRRSATAARRRTP